MAILASWLTDIFTAYKKPGIFAVYCGPTPRHSVGIFKHVGFLPYVRRSVNSQYIRRRTIVRLWVMGVQWIWDYCWYIAGIFADILAWRRIYQEYVGVFCLQWKESMSGTYCHLCKLPVSKSKDLLLDGDKWAYAEMKELLVEYENENNPNIKPKFGMKSLPWFSTSIPIEYHCCTASSA